MAWPAAPGATGASRARPLSQPQITATSRRRASHRAPPEALPHSPSQMPLSCPVAPDRPKLIELQATKPSPTPPCTEEHIATTPGCGPAGRRAFAYADTPNTSPGCRSCACAPSPAGARPRPPARAEENFARRRAPLDHSDARGGAPYRDAGLQTSRPRRPLAHADARGCWTFTGASGVVTAEESSCSGVVGAVEASTSTVSSC